MKMHLLQPLSLALGAQSLEELVEYSEECGEYALTILPKTCCVAIRSMPHRRTS